MQKLNERAIEFKLKKESFFDKTGEKNPVFKEDYVEFVKIFGKEWCEKYLSITIVKEELEA